MLPIRFSKHLPSRIRKIEGLRWKIILLNLLPFIAIGIVLAVMNTHVKVQPGDDMQYVEATSNQGFLEFVVGQYKTWSGRISTNTIWYWIFKSPVTYFRILNALMGFFLTFSMAIHLFGRKFLMRDDQHMRLTLWFLALGFGYLNSYIIIPGMFWMTGSICYLWITTLGSIALIPFSDKYLHNRHTNTPGGPIWIQPVYWVSAALACMGNEQLSMILICVAVAALIVSVLRRQKMHSYLGVLFLIMAGSTVLLASAPGQMLRYQWELKNRFPMFLDLSMTEHIAIGFQWIAYHLIQTNRAILIFFYGFFAFHLSKNNEAANNHEDRFIRGFVWWGVSVIVLMSLNLKMLLMDSSNIVSDILNIFSISMEHEPLSMFPPQWQFIQTLLPYVIWIPLLIMIPVLIAKVCHNTPLHTNILSYLFILGVGSSGLLVLSPTIFVSGSRIWFPFSILALFTLAALLYPISRRIPKPSWIVLYLFPIIKFTLILHAWNAHGFSVPF